MLPYPSYGFVIFRDFVDTTELICLVDVSPEVLALDQRGITDKSCPFYIRKKAASIRGFLASRVLGVYLLYWVIR